MAHALDHHALVRGPVPRRTGQRRTEKHAPLSGPSIRRSQSWKRLLLLGGGLAVGLACVLPHAGLAAVKNEALSARKILNSYRSLKNKSRLVTTIDMFLVNFPRSRFRDQFVYTAGEILFGQGDYQQALKYYKIILTKLPDSKYADSAAFRRAECYYNLGGFNQALKVWQRELSEIAPDLVPEVYNGMAHCYLQKGDWGKAQQQYAELLKAYPQYQQREDIRMALGTMAFYQQDYMRARGWLEGVERPEAALLTARAFRQSHQLAQAAEACDRLIRLFPKAGDILKAAVLEKAEILYDMKQYEWARSAYEYFLANYPVDHFAAHARFRLAVINVIQGQYGDAKKSLDAMAKNSLDAQSNILITYFRAECNSHLGLYQSALNLYSRVWAQTKDASLSADVLLKKARMQFFLRKYAEAQASLQGYVQTFTTSPALPAVYFLLGNANYLQQQYHAAIKVYHDTILNYPYSKVTDACLWQIMNSHLAMKNPHKLIAGTSYILQVLEKNFPPEDQSLRALCHFVLAGAYDQVGQYPNAIRHYLFIGKHFPRASAVLPLARENLAWSYFQNGNYVNAEEMIAAMLADASLDRAIGKRLQLLQAHCRFNQKDYAAAEAAYSGWLQRFAGDRRVPEAMFGLSQTYIRLDKTASALATLNSITQRYAASPWAKKAVLGVGLTHFNRQEYPQAIKAYHFYLAHWPKDPEVQEIKLRIAHTLYNAGENQPARAAYEDYLRQFPQGQYAAAARTGIELTDWRESDTLKKVEKYKAFLTLHPRSEFADLAQYRIGIMLYDRQQYEDSIKELRKLNYNYPGSQYLPNAQYYMGLSYEKLQQEGEAVRIYDYFVQNYSNHDLVPEALSRLGEVQFRQGDFTAAIAAYRQILDKGTLPEYTANALYNIGVCYEQNKAWQDAIEALMAFYQKYPDHAKAQEVIRHIGMVYHQMQKYAQAVEFLQKALAKAAPADMPEVVYRLGNSLENTGQTHQAVEIYQKAKKLTPVHNEYRLTALAQLGAIYEKEKKIDEAVALYRDIQANSKSAQWQQQAHKRIQMLTTP